MSTRFASYATRAVPRYTSYPTAPHFSCEVGAEDYAAWLSQINPREPISLYLHVPFCRELCWYCGCNMKLARKDAPVAEYAQTLMKEIALVAKHLPSRLTVNHLHWGGGTPTALAPHDLANVMELVGQHFDLAEGAELAIESDPRTMSDAMITEIGKIGFTRASFGVQEFDPKVQRAINRIQPPDMVRGCVDALRATGVRGINFDLIYGLPFQTTQTLVETIKLCADMRPDRLALFGYAHVPWMAKKQRLIDEAALPGADERMEQAEAAGDALVREGYLRIGLDHFALPDDPLTIASRSGTLQRNFQGYTTDNASTLIGLGSTAIGKTADGYVQNITETGAWARSVEAGQLPIAKGHPLTRNDALRARVIEALMCFGEVNLDEIGREFRVEGNWYRDAQDELDQLVVDGLIVWEGSTIITHPDALPFVRVVAACFDTYLTRSKARHSVAV